MSKQPGAGSKRVEPYAFLVIGAVSCSMLMYQILLTRISALRLMFHFSFLVVSNCLLGIGAAGTMITIFQDTWRRRARQKIALFSLLYVVSLAVAYAFVLKFPVPAQLDLTRLPDFWVFSSFNLVTATPFFFAGAVVGMVLTFNATAVNRVYFVDLLGAGLGCLVCPLALWSFGAGGAFLLLAVIALLATMLAVPPSRRRSALMVGGALSVIAIALIPRFDSMAPIPMKLGDVYFTQGYRADLAEVIEHSQWSAISRVDLLNVAEDHRFLFSRGRNDCRPRASLDCSTHRRLPRLL